MGKIIYLVYPTAQRSCLSCYFCISIGSDIDFETFKIVYLDIGLCQAILGSDISIWFLSPLEGFENRGEIAEGFIGQELICYANPENKAELYFWKRKAKNSLAKIDYLIQRGDQILPIEVKSGHGNTLRSLHFFLESHPKSNLAIRFSSLNYSIRPLSKLRVRRFSELFWPLFNLNDRGNILC